MPENPSFYFNRIKRLKLCTQIKLKNQNDISTKLDTLSHAVTCAVNEFQFVGNI